MRIIFMGTPGFAVPCLQKLIDAGHDICGVFTQPDKPKEKRIYTHAASCQRIGVAARIDGISANYFA